MKVYSNAALNVLYIEGTDYGPCDDYRVEWTGQLISIYRISQSIYVFKNYDYSKIQDQSGGGFTDAESCYRYLMSLTVATFPLRFTVSYPLALNEQVVSVDPDFLAYDIHTTDGGNF